MATEKGKKKFLAFLLLLDSGFEIRARIYRPSFHENKPKTLVFSHTKRAFWACFRENCVYNFGHSSVCLTTTTFILSSDLFPHSIQKAFSPLFVLIGSSRPPPAIASVTLVQCIAYLMQKRQ